MLDDYTRSEIVLKFETQGSISVRMHVIGASAAIDR